MPTASVSKFFLGPTLLFAEFPYLSPKVLKEIAFHSSKEAIVIL
jgi:hypothetical protein